MLTEENYQLAWNFYIVAALLGVALVWWLVRRWHWRELQVLLLVFAASLLLTPVQADPEQAYLAPAFLVYTLELLFEGADQAARAGIPLLKVCVSALVITLLGQIGWRLYRRKQIQREAMFSTSEQEEASRSELLNASQSQ